MSFSYKPSKFFYAILLCLCVLSLVAVRPCNALFLDWYSGDKVFKYRLTGAVCSYLERFYVDPERIHAQHLLFEALNSTERLLPEVLVDPSEPSDALELTIGEYKKKLDISKVQTVDDMLTLLKDSLLFIQTNRQEPNDPKPAEVEYAAINGMLGELDPHSILLSPKEFKEFKIGTSGRFGGLGMVVGIREMVLTVVSPIEGTPAYKAGLKTGDKIMEIDGESTVNMSLYEAVNKLRGEPGTKVTLLVRGKSLEPKLLTLKREIIALPSVESQVMQGHIGYIKVRNFQEDTSEDLDRHLQHLQKELGDIKGLILDLRNNSGGLLDQAVWVADRFLDNGIVVVTVGPGKKQREVQRAQPAEGDKTRCPLIVIIDAESASGSEIVAGALRENNRGIIIGDRSFGKGTVQQLIDMADGSALKLTVAKYLTPFYRDIQTVGITPDIELFPVVVGKDTINLFRGNVGVLREEDMRGHLHGGSSMAEKPLDTLRYLSQALEETPSEKEEEDPYKVRDLSKDRQVQLAHKLLRGTTSYTREEMLEELSPLLEDVKREEEKKIATTLAGAGIDWSQGISPEPANPSALLSFDPPGEKIKAGDKVTLTLSVTNKGGGTLYQMHATSESKNPLLDKLEFPLGKIEPGVTKSYSRQVEIPQNNLDRSDEFLVKFNELNGNTPKDIYGTLTIEALPRPQFAYSYQLVESGTNGHRPNDDGLIQKGETLELLVTARNIGEGKSTKNMVTLRNLSHKEVFVEQGSQELGELAPGESKTVRLRFNVRESLEANEFTMDLVITDITFSVYLTDKLVFPVMESRVSPPLVDVSKSIQVLKEDTWAYGGRSTDSPQMALLAKGSTVRAEGWVPSWYMVRLPNGGTGWIPARDVGEAKEPALNGLELYLQRIPPIIQFQRPSSPVGSNRVALSGESKDDGLVKYVFVMVNNNKVYFKLQKKGKKAQGLDFTAELPLKEGPNTVTVVAKDDLGLVSSRSFMLSGRPTLVKGEGAESK